MSALHLYSTLAENIALGCENIDHLRMNEIIEKVSLGKWVKTLPDGADTILSEAGCELSGGQKQRVAIVRSLAMEPDVILFDEPTSNLDVTTEKKIIKMIEKHLNNKTYIIVTHRVVKIKESEGNLYFYTKGDANDNVDVGFVHENNIVGVVNFKISYIGYPSLWIRDLFNYS